MNFVTCNQCRVCGNSDLVEVINLGNQALSCCFPKQEEPDPFLTPVRLLKCNDFLDKSKCGLLQLGEEVNADILYKNFYGYCSSLNSAMVKHLHEIAEEAMSKVDLKMDDLVLDIASNDGTLLKSYPSSILKVGIDPTSEQFKDHYTSEIIRIPDYFTAKVFKEHLGNRKAKIITSICVFYDLPDPIKFAKDVAEILSFDGIWVLEMSYLGEMLRTKSIDTICIEHISYYSFKVINYIMSRVNLKILDATLNSSNGGSFRITVAHQKSIFPINFTNIQKFIDLETKHKLDTFETYENFKINGEITKRNITKFLKNMKKFEKDVWLYSASTKGNTLLQYLNITPELVTAAAEINEDKWGRRTPGTNIPIVSETEMRVANPDYLYCSAWHFKSNFIEREHKYLEQGGAMIFPLPTFTIYTLKKKALVFGGNSQIGHYLIENLLHQNYMVFATVYKNQERKDSRIHYLEVSFENFQEVEITIDSIEPSEIYNLAGETDTLGSFKDPIKCFDINAKVLHHICDAILKLKNRGIMSKLFQASSAEIYKGLLDGSKLIVNEKVNNYKPLTPYAVSKTTADTICRYYRDYYGLHISIGILFNTESPRRLPRYLTQKISHFLSEPKSEPLKVGNIYNYRDISHAFDVANAIHLIISQEIPDDYIVSSFESILIKDLISLFFKAKNIDLIWYGLGTDVLGLDSKTGKIWIKIDPSFIRPFEINEHLVGDNSKLKSIGWKPKYTIESLVKEMVN